jgi:hypothetical protein
MKYLKSFENHSQYESYTADTTNFIKPNVSLCVNENEVHYNPLSPTPPTPSHDYVDLGLPSGTKWATMNIGAESELDCGNYYQYGKGAATYQETSGDTDYEGTENPLAASADTATQVWGSLWHMPTSAQFQELFDNLDSEATNIDDVLCTKFIGQNGNYVIFPWCGGYQNGTLTSVNYMGLYWGSNTENIGEDEYQGSAITFYNDGDKDVGSYGKNNGFPIRPVMDA